MMYFYREIEIDVPENVYYPREDSELLAEALENMDLGGKKALDVCCGSGVLSVIMAKAGADVTAADINESAVSAAKKNAKPNGVKIRAISSDLFSNVKGIFDLIVFNPPYLPDADQEIVFRKEKVRGVEAQWSGGSTGRDLIERFANDAKNHLAPNGRILMVISSLTGEKEIIALFTKKGMSAQPLLREKVPWEELVVLEIL